MEYLEMTQKITPFLWFDTQAEQAMNHYVSLFRDGEALHVSRMDNSGPDADSTVTVASFRLGGLEISAFNAGPTFAPTPAVSFMVTCEDEAEIDALWAGLSEGGTEMMPLQQYPFSEKYGWVQDRF